MQTLNIEYHIKPLSERALLVQFTDIPDIQINRQVIALHRLLNSEPVTGFVESVPGYSSLGVFFDIQRTGLPLTGTINLLTAELMQRIAQLNNASFPEGELVTIPVRYGGEHGPDIGFVAEQNGISVEEVIALHTGTVYHVFMLGFLPGFPYMGFTDKQLTVPRKASPRTVVPAGSVALAGNQTGIYPQTSPGGWQIIGQTDMVLFNNTKQSPCLLQPGNRVRFTAV